MTEITLTVIAQIINFFLIWYVFHAFLLKKVFATIKATKDEVAALDYSIVLAREAIKKEEANKKEEWNKFLVLFSQKIPYRVREEYRKDILPLCHITTGLKKEEEKIVVQETVTYLVRRIVNDN